MVNYTSSDLTTLTTSVIGAFMNGLNDNAGLIIILVIATFALGAIAYILNVVKGFGGHKGK